MAGKPDDISQEAWDAADAIGEQVLGRHERGFVMWPLAIPAHEIAARAIMAATAAEREACAILAANRWQLWGHEKRDQLFKVDLASCNDIASAIRSRGEA